MRRLSLALLVAIACWSIGIVPAQEPLPWEGSGLTITEAHPLLRGGLLYRFHLQPSSAVQGLVPPLRLDLRLLHGAQALAARRLTITDTTTWAAGLDAHLQPPGRLPLAPLRLIAVLTDAAGHVDRLEVPVASVASLQGTLVQAARAYDRQHPSARDPLLGLWLEQATILVAGSRRLSDCERLLRLSQAIAQAPASLAQARAQVHPTVQDAFAARSDGSPQPLRWHRSSAPTRGLMVWLQGFADAPSKIAWPEPPAAMLEHAAAAGWVVVEVYPAGDPHWRDLARHRLDQALSTLLRQRPDWADLPHCLAAQGPAAAAALHLAAADPWAWSSLLLHRPEAATPRPGLGSGLPDEQRAWLTAALGRENDQYIAQLTGRLAVTDGAGDLNMPADTVRFQPGDPALWAWLAEQASGPLPPRLELDWPVPRQAGPLALVSLQAWGRPALLQLVHQQDRWQLTGSNLGRLAWDDGAGPAPLRSGTPLPEHPYQRLPDKRLGSPTGLAAGYAAGAWVLVVGSGETAAAALQNRRNAGLVQEAWARVSQGSAPVLGDDAKESQLHDRNLICLGNPRSNAVLRRLLGGDSLPLRWDGHMISMPATGASWQRAESGVVLVRPHPRHRDRVILIADGPALHRLLGPGQPFAELPDLSIIDPSGLQQWLQDADWQLMD